MRHYEISRLRSLPLFSEISDDSLNQLLTAALLQQFPAGVVLIHEGEPADFLHVLIEGLVEIFSDHGSGESGISLLKPVSTFILAAVVSDQPYLSSARTLAESQVLMIPTKHFRELFNNDLVFAKIVAQQLALAYRGSIKKLKGYMARSSMERLANWILAEAKFEKGPTNFVIPFDRGTLASHIGTTRENLSRSLALLADHGIRIRGREIVMEDRDKLELFAKPRSLIDDPSS